MRQTNHQQPASSPLADRDTQFTLGSWRISGASRRLEADERLFLEGDPATRVFKVVRGLVRCFQMTEDGRRHICRFAGPGDLLGLAVLEAYRYSAEAVGPSIVISTPRCALEASADPEIRTAVVRELVRKLIHGERSQLRLSRLTAHERVADFLAEIVGNEPAGATATRRIAMSRLDIADYLGLTLETVSRGLHRLDWMGVIELVDAHQFRVRNLNSLRRIAGGDRDGDVGRAA